MIILFILLFVVNLLYLLENNSLHFTFSVILFFMFVSILKKFISKKSMKNID